MRKAFISPSKYVQGEDELLNLGYFVKSFGKSALLIAHKDDVSRVSDKLKSTAEKYDIVFVESNFKGECSRTEVERLKNLASEKKCDSIIGLGGGKAIDAAKCVAEGDSLIIVPTIAATDAPTSHSAVLYTEDGAFDDYAYFKQSPSVVLIDTSIIAKAPVRFLVSGMGDALATYFEARATSRSFSNVNAGLPCGALHGDCMPAKSTIAAETLAEKCYEILLKDGFKAKLSCESGCVTPALENIIEANILLSGLGFESAGLAGAHAIHDGLTIIEETHSFYHGEKVAFGVIAQLVLENAPQEEIAEVVNFCISLGLPVCFEDLGIKSMSEELLMQVAEKACIPEESVHSMPFPVLPNNVASAIKVADLIGKQLKKATKI